MTTDSQDKKVSVVIPTYNRAHFISNAINSVISQNYHNIEIIIVDDGSDDNTQEVVESLKEQHKSILYCKNYRAKGPSGARNTGILKATGYYLAFLDSDDVWLDNHLLEGIAFLDKHPEIDLLFGNFSVVDYRTGKHQYNFFDKKTLLHKLKSTHVPPHYTVLHDNILTALVQEGFFHLGGTILRKSVAEGILFDEAIMFTEDRDFAIRLYKEANAAFAYNKDPVFNLHIHNSNLHNNENENRWQKTIESHLYLFTKYLEDFNLSNSENKLLSKIIVKLNLNLSYLHSKNMKFMSVVLYLLRSSKYTLVFLKESCVILFKNKTHKESR